MLSPGADAERSTSSGPVDVDMRHYNNLMSVVPLESTSIPLIMHCMLEQVGTLPSAAVISKFAPNKMSSRL